jgi:hypothetical protein
MEKEEKNFENILITFSLSLSLSLSVSLFLTLSSCNNKGFGKRYFAVAAAAVWGKKRWVCFARTDKK